MKAMIFAAGLGTRLKPLTDTMPKALVPVNGEPLLHLTINRLIQCGADEIVVNVHHFASQIISYLQTHHYPCKITVSDESEELLDTGGGLKKAIPLFRDSNEPILIHNVDILSNADLTSFYKRNASVDAALLVSGRKSSRKLLFNQEGRLVGWTNLQTGEVKSPFPHLDIDACKAYAFSGIHVVSPGLYPLMAHFPAKFSIIDFYLAICDKVQIMADYRDDLTMLDVGKLDTLKQAETFILELNK